MNETSNDKAQRSQDESGASPATPMIDCESWLIRSSRFRIKRILVPVDFSESCLKAVKYGVVAAAESGAEMTLLHVVKHSPIPPELTEPPPALEESIRNSALEQLEKWRKSIHEISAHALVCVGQPAREIVAEAKKLEVDLIIISTHGRTGIAHAVMGSVAEQVVRWAPCPVLVVRDSERDFLTLEPDDPNLHRIGLFTRDLPTETVAKLRSKL